MGWADNRKSPKMRRRIRHRKYKERVKRQRERLHREREQQH
jgi:hypothetical protein